MGFGPYWPWSACPWPRRSRIRHSSDRIVFVSDGMALTRLVDDHTDTREFAQRTESLRKLDSLGLALGNNDKEGINARPDEQRFVSHVDGGKVDNDDRIR